MKFIIQLLNILNQFEFEYASYIHEIFSNLLWNYSRYAANLNMKAINFFLTHPVGCG